METVAIDRLRLQDLERAELKLSCLEHNGVDNWIGYDDSMREYFEILEDEARYAKEND